MTDDDPDDDRAERDCEALTEEVARLEARLEVAEAERTFFRHRFIDGLIHRFTDTGRHESYDRLAAKAERAASDSLKAFHEARKGA